MIWSWGYAIVQRSIDRLETGVEEYMAGSPFQERCKAILRELKTTKNGYMAHSSLLRKKGVGIHDQRKIKSAYDRLVEMDKIERSQVVRGGLRVTLKEAVRWKQRQKKSDAV